MTKYKLKSISKVVLKVGEMTCINDQALEFAFQIFAENTMVEGAELIIKTVDARAKCDQCDHIFKITYTDKFCPLCGSYCKNVMSGYELLLDEVEGETDENNKN